MYVFCFVLLMIDQILFFKFNHAKNPRTKCSGTPCGQNLRQSNFETLAHQPALVVNVHH